MGVQCGLTSLARFGREDVIFFRWIFFAAFAVILCFAVTSLAVHLYFACSVKFTSVNGSKMGGALLISFSCICQMIRHEKNPLGLVEGYPDPGSLLLNKVFFFFFFFFFSENKKMFSLFVNCFTIQALLLSGDCVSELNCGVIFL